MDLGKLTKADRILFGAGVVFFVSLFLDWFSVTAGPFSVGASGWDVGFLWATLPFLVVAAMLVWIGLARFSSVKLPSEIAPLYLAGGVGVALLVVLKLIIGEDYADRAFGMFLATLAALAFGAGGFLKFQESGGDLDALKAQLKSTAESLGDKDKKSE